jgi:hypothetical protein
MTTSTPCEHLDATSARVGQDPVASAWECDDCGHLTPFTEADYAFCNASPWTPRRPESVDRLTWLFTSRERKVAHYAAA